MVFLGICILLSTFIYVDAKMFINGYESVFFHAKTEREKEIRERPKI